MLLKSKTFIKRAFIRLINLHRIEPFLVRRLSSTVTILTYHGIAPSDCRYHSWTLVPADQFDKQLEYLKKTFDVISMDDLVCLAGEKQYLFKPKAIITFDDGLKNNLYEALPLLAKHRLPATIYVSTEAVETGRHFWWDLLILSIQTLKLKKLDLSCHGLPVFHFIHTSNGLNQIAWGKIQYLLGVLKQLPPDRREKVLSDTLSKIGSITAQRNSPFMPLSAKEVASLAASPLIQIGSHTHCHNILSQIPLKQALFSIKRSINLLGNWTQTRIRHFSFPNGEHVQQIESALPKIGLVTASTCLPGRWRPGQNLLRVPRLGVGGYDTLNLFKANLIGGLGMASRYLNQ